MPGGGLEVTLAIDGEEEQEEEEENKESIRGSGVFSGPDKLLLD